MDSIGTLDLAWAQGYSGSDALFINRNTLCYVCGNGIKFIDITTGREEIYSSPGMGIGAFTVSGSTHLVAFSENCLNPRIFVFSYPGFTQKSVCQGGTKMEYSALAFSHTHPYLASCSAIPDFMLSLWNWETGELLCSKSMWGLQATNISFNPTDWHRLSVIGPDQLTVWTIEQADKLFSLIPSKTRLPYGDETGSQTTIKDGLPDRPGSRMEPFSINVDKAAVAGLVGEHVEAFDANFDENHKKVEPASLCWTATGDIYCGCQGGQLLKYNTETQVISVLYNPGDNKAVGFVSRVTTADEFPQKLFTVPDGEETKASPGKSLAIREGTLNCLALHREGLFAGGDDGILRCLDVNHGVVQVSDSWNSGAAISSLGWSPGYTKLAIGSPKGCLYLYDYTNPGTAQPLIDTHNGDFIAVAMMAPGTQHCVSVRDNGEVQVWSMEDNKLACSLSLKKPASCLASSPSSHTVAVGTLTGHVFLLDLSNLENPRVVQRLHMHQSPVQQLVFDEEGRYLLTGADDGHVFVVDARPSSGFKILGQTPIEGLVQTICSNTEEKHGAVKVLVTSSTTSDAGPGANKCAQFDIPSNLAQDVDSFLASAKCDLKEGAINKMNLNFSVPSCGAALTTGGVFFTLSYDTKQLHKLTLPEEAPKKANNKASYLQPQGEFQGHELPGGILTMSHHQKWLASAAPDGHVQVRGVGALDRPMVVSAHSFLKGGVRQVCLSTDAQSILTCGTQDGVLSCYTWNFSNTGRSKATSAIEAARSHNAMLHAIRKREDEVLSAMPEWSEGTSTPMSRSVSDMQGPQKTGVELAIERDEIYMTPTPTLKADPTWMEVKEMEALREEDNQYAELKTGLRGDIRELRRTIQSMMKENEGLPDIEQLGHDEFNLDSEEQQRLQAMGEAKVQEMRVNMELDDLSKTYLREVIKNECWDSMLVKGRSIKAFHMNLEVGNYPMRDKTKKEVDELAFVTKMRSIEVAEMAARKEIVEVQPKGNSTKASDAEFADDESEEGDGKEQPSTIGSLGAQYGGGSDLFYSQFELHTRQQKRNQILLLQDAIYRIKMAFNREFDEIFRAREQEIGRINDRNLRIMKIMEDLSSKEKVWKPQMDDDEKPEKLLTVEDSEVKVEKFITAEQRAKMEEEEAKEEERKLREKGDNARDRALDMMMGGVLEIKKEDELKKDVPVPTFMAKDPEEWSEEEQKAHKEYERKVKELNEEREKYRKTLEAEMKKIQTIIADTTSNFDDRLVDRFHKKIKTEMVIYQEELKILRLNRELLIEEELDAQENELNRQLDSKRALKQETVQAVLKAKRVVDSYRDTYDIRVAEDKVLEKNFRKEFPDVHAIYVDQLFKLYRRRPRGQRRDQKGSISETPVGGMTNPYGERPLSARQSNTTVVLMKGLDELDNESHCPEGVEPHVWTRMCSLRRTKALSEQEVKVQALTLADMNAFQQHRQEEDDRLKNEIEDTVEALNRLRDERFKFNCNLDVQFLLKQGQVEVDSGPFIHNFSDSILIHRGVVEDLNGSIRQLGEQKIAAMTESKDFRKGIHILEWEHKKMVMQIEDLLNKARTIQMLKVSRDLQNFLHNEDHEARRQQEISTLESTLENQRAHHEKNCEERKKIVKKLRQTIRGKEKNNATLDKDLEEMNVSVAERKHINEVNAAMRNVGGSAQRMRDIVQRRKLVDLAKAQAQEVAVLRAEVERLRMRTFPALVQVER
ncbi:cilia- and flagella-associated protein 43-like isoform X1 [Asterias rubens]|uniref:cilia- and flagella-associated protein 43-like isoform X1 n=1 Tax=Asterias rubens TaxID=7604 RepID=UPI001455CB34|nr:cilia- and flagella-associated protein 43-like isoform X1 [Asterias rubens]